MTQTAQKTGKIIIAVIFTQALTLSLVGLSYAEQEPCDPVLGMCLLPVRPEAPSDEEYLKLFEAVEEETLPRLAFIEETHERMFKRQTLECHVLPKDSNSLTLADKLAGEFSSLGEHIILKAKEAGMLLQLPNFFLNFMETCGLRSDRQCGDETLLTGGKPRIPYNRQLVYCSEES
jgi:hypothetical protein